MIIDVSIFSHILVTTPSVIISLTPQIYLRIFWDYFGSLWWVFWINSRLGWRLHAMSHYPWPLTQIRSSCKSKRFEYDVTLWFIWAQQFSIAIFCLDNFSETRNKNVELYDDRNRVELSKFYPTRNFLILCWNNFISKIDLPYWHNRVCLYHHPTTSQPRPFRDPTARCRVTVTYKSHGLNKNVSECALAVFKKIEIKIRNNFCIWSNW